MGFAAAGEVRAMEHVALLIRSLERSTELPTARKLFARTSLGMAMRFRSSHKNIESMDTILTEIRKVQSSFLKPVVARLVFEVTEAVEMDPRGWIALWDVSTNEGGHARRRSGLTGLEVGTPVDLFRRPFLPSAVRDVIAHSINQRPRSAGATGRGGASVDAWLAKALALANQAVLEEERDVKALRQLLVTLGFPVSAAKQHKGLKRATKGSMGRIWKGIIKRGSL
ncbi:hypothetical protein HDU93_002541, partial [Gonapodya sp. JEL0774]